MQHDIKIKDPCPWDKCSFISRFFFAWMIPIFRKGYNKELEFVDLHKYCEADTPERVADRLERNWNKELETQRNPNVVKALGRAFGLRYLLYAAICLITECVAKTFQPFLIGVVVRSFSKAGFDDEAAQRRAYMAAAGICISSVLETFGRNHYQLLVRRVALNCRTSLTILVYKKILRLSMSSFDNTSVGQVLNILANDFNRFDELGHVLIYIAIAPIQSAIVMYIMWQSLGVACVGGMVILFMFIPFQGLMGRLFNRFRRRTTVITDKRIRLMGEIIAAIKLIKVYCWEKPFADVIRKIRKDEINLMKWTSLLKGTNSALFFVACRIMLFATFMVHLYKGKDLTADAVFVTMSLFNAIRLPVTNQFPNAVGLGAESLVACKRIQKILLLPEKEPNSSNQLRAEPGSVRVVNYSGKWSKGFAGENLKNISMEVKPKQLVVVIGSVGSGKTCLLHALLNEIETVAGDCQLNGTVSYAPQEAWCFMGSIRENITLGETEKAFDQRRYDEVIKICCLDRDLQLFPEGDKTFVGEKGYTLSGGQKARLSLARAVYNNSDIYLLDDPLSAVDPHVASHIFEECVRKFLRNKTVILVTHQLQFIEKADRIICLKDGSTVIAGSYDEIIRSGTDIFAHLEENKVKEEEVVSSEDTRSIRSRRLSESRSRRLSRVSRRSSISSQRWPLTADSIEDNDMDEDDELDELDIHAENKSEGSVKMRVYWEYIRSGATVPSVIVLAIALVVPQVIFQYTDLWLAGWTKDYEVDTTRNQTSIHRDLQSEMTNVYIYSGLITSLFLSAFFRVICLYLVCLRCSIKLHERIFSNLLRAPMRFFETNPTGRVLNRFTRDLGQIDQKVPATMDDLIGTFLNVIGILVVSAIVSPYLLIPIVILAVLSVPLRRIYIRTARDIQRLDAISRSPVYSHISSTVDGLTAVRAFGLEQRFVRQYYVYVNDSTAVRFLVLATGRAYSFCLDSFALTYIIAVNFFLMAIPDGLPSGDVGLVLSSVLVLIGLFQGCIRRTADFETQMVSCERVLEYGQLPTEAPLHNFQDENNRVARNKLDEWPSEGSIKFKNVSVRYGDNPLVEPVLKNLTFSVRGGEKVGIVGRTGAGKSSLISILFRLVEPDGDVIIDNLDTQMLGLHELREKISIIPQDPVLFSGTIRRNLDPFRHYRDDELLSALQDANLSKLVESNAKLESLITEGGSNLSVGERQLLCLARALLKQNKILVLDEATANVDLETDELIQRTIKTKFVNCTVLTVAHRLNTIIDMDKVLVLDAGRVVEFDEPYLLLSGETGHFYYMVKQTGDQYCQILINSAKKAFYTKREMNMDSSIELRERL